MTAARQVFLLLYYLLVFVDKVVNNLGPAVGQVDNVLACDI